MSRTTRNEIVLAGAMLVFGVFVLPYAIYFVGLRVVGPYDGGEGAVDLALAIWTGLARLQWSAWLLVLGPYAVAQLLRLALHTARARRRVNAVTE